MIIGTIGLILIALSWLPQIIEILKTKKSGLNPKFALIYVLGSIALIIHAIEIKDTIFIILNSTAGLMSFLGLYYTLKYRKKS
ncbi:hypothetical protein GOV14_05450 [Candidatus Pacearchaeota archaeon]|nr:hypothetical protein [Candidatus Pacearchaeota archaeon]